MAVFVPTGLTAAGERDILGLDVGDREDEVFWRGFLNSLKRCGLGGVRLVINDQHARLAAALSRAFHGWRANAARSASLMDEATAEVLAVGAFSRT